MRLVIVSDALLVQHENEYFSEDTFLKFAACLRPYCQDLTVLCPVRRQNGNASRVPPFRVDNEIRIVGTRPYRTELEYYKKAVWFIPRIAPTFWRCMNQADALLLRVPSMHGRLAALCARLCRKPIFTYLIGDQRTAIQEGNKYKGLARVVARTAVELNSRFHKRLVEQSEASFFMSGELLSEFGSGARNACFFFTSLIEQADLTHSHDTGIGPGGRLNLLFVGRLSHEKGVEYLIEALGLLRESGLSAHLCICGDGPCKGELQQLVEQRKLAQFTEFLGFLPWGRPLYERYDAADVFVLPSVSEGVPKVLLEAMARGVPIVASGVGGVRDVIQHMHNGILVPAKSPQAIADAVRLLAGDPALTSSLSANGLEYAEQHTIEKQAAALIGTIQELSKG